MSVKLHRAGPSRGTIRIGGTKEDRIHIKVDNFTGKADAFFLTHTHTDHLGGLSPVNGMRWNSGSHGGGKIFCTLTTYNLLMSKVAPDTASIVVLDEGSNAVELPDGTYLQVNVISDFHCLGHCLFIIQYNDEVVLHTGDYKYFDGLLDVVREHLPTNQPNFRVYIDTTFWHKSWLSEKVPSQVESVQLMVNTIETQRRSGGRRRNVLLLLSPLGQESILRLLFSIYRIPVLLDLHHRITSETKKQWTFLLEHESTRECVTSDRKRVEGGDFFIEAVPAFTSRRTREQKALYKKASDQEKQRLDAIRKRIFCKWNECEKLSRRLEEGEITKDDLPHIFRLSTLRFCEYDARGMLKWNGKCSSEGWHETRDSEQPNKSKRTDVKVHHILFLMHSSRREHEELIKGLASPKVLCGLHGHPEMPFGKMLQRGPVHEPSRDEEDRELVGEAVVMVCRGRPNEDGPQDGGGGDEDCFPDPAEDTDDNEPAQHTSRATRNLPKTDATEDIDEEEATCCAGQDSLVALSSKGLQDASVAGMQCGEGGGSLHDSQGGSELAPDSQPDEPPSPAKARPGDKRGWSAVESSSLSRDKILLGLGARRRSFGGIASERDCGAGCVPVGGCLMQKGGCEEGLESRVAVIGGVQNSGCGICTGATGAESEILEVVHDSEEEIEGQVDDSEGELDV